MRMLDPADFRAATKGGRPNQMKMHYYVGHVFDCACGQAHAYSDDIPVLHELPGKRLILVCPRDNSHLTCVKIRGLLWFKGFESLYGTHYTQRQRDLMRRAFALPGTAQMMVIPSYTNFADAFPSIAQVQSKVWDFFMTAAATYVAASVLSEEESRLLEEPINMALEEWDDEGGQALEDCAGFVERAIGEEEPSPDLLVPALGTWVLWNIQRRRPDRTEAEAVGPIGHYLVATMANYWDADQSPDSAGYLLPQ